MTRYQFEMYEALYDFLDIYNTTGDAFVKEMALNCIKKICGDLGIDLPKRKTKEGVES